MSRPLADVVEDVHARRASSRELALESLGAISRLDPGVSSFLEVHSEGALADAQAVDARLARGERPPLAGLVVALKDNICFDRGRTTAGSRILEGYRSPFAATAAQRLRDAGAVVVGKTNMDEFGFGSSTEHSAFFPTRNPWDGRRVPGGSSGGSAAAVAAGLVHAALGSDTGGSIRQPASFCGIVGLKPTYGRVSRHGLIAFASSLDQIGPMTRRVEDSLLLLRAIAGHDPLDSTSSRHAPALAGPLAPRARPPTIGIPRAVLQGALHEDVRHAIDSCLEILRRAGGRLVDVELPSLPSSIATYYVLATAEAGSNLARMDGIRFGRRSTPRPGESLADLYSRSRAEGFGREAVRRIMLGTHVLRAGYADRYYARAQKARRAVLDDYRRCFDLGVDAVILPTAPTPAFRLGEKTSDPLALYLEDLYTVGVNLAGLPAISLPAGFAKGDGADLPVGVQLVGRAFDEAGLLSIARLLEDELSLTGRRPPMLA